MVILISFFSFSYMTSYLLQLLVLPVGFHHYILENFTGDKLEGLSDREVLEFDPPSEVRILV